jgi:hypothetical protein
MITRLRRYLWHDMPYSNASVILTTLMLGLFLAACGQAPSPTEQNLPLAMPTIPTLARLRSTDTPTSTLEPFSLRPTYTPVPPTPTLVLTELPGFGYGPRGFPADINPLTGQKVSDLVLLERRPMAIKITNFPRSVRPQWGLNAADHIYEYYLEDELTRFIAVFYGQDATRVGPVRSARPFDENILRAYKAIFAFGYADDRVIEPWEDSDISPYLVIEHKDNCPPLCRIGSASNYNTLYADTAALSQYVTDKGISNGRQNLDGLRFETTSLVTYGGGAANRLEVRFSPMSYNYWDYDPSAGRYRRWQDTEREAEDEETYEPLLDSLTNQQVSADNVIVLLVPMDFFFKSNSTEIFAINLLGTGKAYALRDGRVFAITWQRVNPADMISLRFPNGSPYPLKTGNVWFEVLSATSPHKVNGQTWRFTLDLPVYEGTPTPIR